MESLHTTVGFYAGTIHDFENDASSAVYRHLSHDASVLPSSYCKSTCSFVNIFVLHQDKRLTEGAC